MLSWSDKLWSRMCGGVVVVVESVGVFKPEELPDSELLESSTLSGLGEPKLTVSDKNRLANNSKFLKL